VALYSLIFEIAEVVFTGHKADPGTSPTGTLKANKSRTEPEEIGGCLNSGCTHTKSRIMLFVRSRTGQQRT
jgi:hypothetical protein